MIEKSFFRAMSFSLVTNYFLLFSVTFFCQWFVSDVHVSIFQHVLTSVIYSFIYFLLLQLLISYSVWRLSLIWLGIPFFIFALGWLRWYWALSCCAIWGLALNSTIRSDSSIGIVIGKSQLAAYLLILVWIYFSGAGGYGNQSTDYIMHNGRLVDLIEQSWPVHYAVGYWVSEPSYGAQHSYLVGYLAYYMPAALIGKLFGKSTAFEVMHFWSLCGAWLALTWIWDLAGKKLGFFAAVVLIIFGGLDILGFFTVIFLYIAPFLDKVVDWPLIRNALFTFTGDAGGVDFWPTIQMGFFFGNYLSNAASIFFAPHQVLAAWVAGGLLMRGFINNRYRDFGFICALLVFWSPAAMMSIVLFPFALVFCKGVSSFRKSISFENFIAGGSLILVFGFYYLAGSATTNPLIFLWEREKFQDNIFVFILFHFISWGAYSLIVLSGWKIISYSEKVFFIFLCISFFCLSLVFYGEFNDLLCRGSSILMFFMMIFLLKLLVYFFEKRLIKNIFIGLVVLFFGSYSAFAHLGSSVLFVHTKIDPVSVVDYRFGYEFLGRVDSFFVSYLSKDTAVMSMQKKIESQ